MERAYHKWHSPALGREMELLVFGHSGDRVLVFPTRAGRFYDYENWGLVGAVESQISRGAIQLFCVDSIDAESLYSETASPQERIKRQYEFEAYLLNEVVPFSESVNTHGRLVSTGCSLGAYHAVNLAFRHPERFSKVVALSGRYDLTKPLGPFRDLFDGYYDSDIYFNNPSHFIPNMWDTAILDNLRRMKIILTIGLEDAFFENNREFSEALKRLQIPHILEEWTGEAHRPRYWREMIAKFL